MSYEQLTDRIVDWAETCADIRAVLVVGSRARVDHPADEWSDLDLIILTTDTQRYLTAADWLADVGSTWLTFLERTAAGDESERRVLFEGGLDVDFIPVPVESIQRKLRDPIVTAIIQRGVRVLLDKDGVTSQLALATGTMPSSRAPGPEELEETISDFWYHAVWTAKKLRRGELWTAKSCSDVYMKSLLLRMIEWHARTINGPDYDTWFGGRFLERWAPQPVLEALGGTFARYDECGVWRALLATMDMFRWLATDVAHRLGYPYPTAADGQVTAWVEAHLPDAISRGPSRSGQQSQSVGAP